MSPVLILLSSATVLLAASGLPGLFARRRASWGEQTASILIVLGATAGFIAVTLILTSGTTTSLSLPLPLIPNAIAFKIDPLSAFFLVPIFLIGTIGPIYGLSYWRQRTHATNGRKLRLFWAWMLVGMVLLVCAGNAIVFLMGWEIMAISGFYLITTQDHLVEVRQAGWIYLIAAHLGVLCLAAVFLLMYHASGTFDLVAIHAHDASLALLTTIFLLALLGFGLKAGIMPFHFWLPAAHANSPSHVSALLSGVMLKMGIYGLVRVCSLLPHPPVLWGMLLLILGAVSGILGVAFAIGQHDFKRLLAYHSVENIGIIIMGLGLAMVGRSLGRTDWIVLGLAGCLLHVWNHALFKSLLFFSAGSVLHATHTRDMDHLGGLAKSMPWTSTLFLVGALAICGLPPLNGFISELFIYMGFFHALNSQMVSSWAGLALAVPTLATIGALALACFVKAHGSIFLGQPRSQHALNVHESPRSMLVPMGILATLCLFIGIFPILIAPLLDKVIATWFPHSTQTLMPLASFVPLKTIGIAGLSLALLLIGFLLILFKVLRTKQAPQTPTWSCGYAQPTPKMQYTSSSFAQTLVRLFSRILHPKTQQADISGLFPHPTSFHSHILDTVLHAYLFPFTQKMLHHLSKIRHLQHGISQQNILLFLLAIFSLLLWSMPLQQFVENIFTR